LTESHGVVIACVRVLFFKKIVPIIKNQAVNLNTNSVKVSQRDSCFIVVLLLIFSSNVLAQQPAPRDGKNPSHPLRQKEIFVGINDTIPSSFFKRVAIPIRRIEENNLFFPVEHTPGNTMVIVEFGPLSHLRYVGNIPVKPTQLPFFCEKEIQFEKLSSIPLRLRLGSLEYVNKLEGKEK